MIILRDKLQNIYNKFSSLLPQFKVINVVKLNSLPLQIKNMVIGDNKISSYLNMSIQQVALEDFSGLANIPQSFFSNYTNLTYVAIPDSITNISYNAFGGCTNLSNIYIYSATPPTLESSNAIPTTTTIHVPVGSGDAYKSATNWSYYSDRIVEDIVIE